MAIVDKATGRYVVDIMPDGRVPLATLQASLQGSYPLMTVKALDTSYRAESESALLITLGPGHYTSIVRGANNTSGVGLAEAYKLDN